METAASFACRLIFFMNEASCCDTACIAHAFVSVIPQKFDYKITTEWRRNEIANAKSLKVKREKAFAWILLEYAVKTVFGNNLESFSPKKNENGKLVFDKIFASISHSGNYVIAVVAKNPVGCDIEEIKQRDFSRLVEKFTTENEKQLFNTSNDKITCFYKLWTAKEALFKLSKGTIFSPQKISVDNKVNFFRAENFITAVAFDSKIRFSFLRYNNGMFLD